MKQHMLTLEKKINKQLSMVSFKQQLINEKWNMTIVERKMIRVKGTLPSPGFPENDSAKGFETLRVD